MSNTKRRKSPAGKSQSSIRSGSSSGPQSSGRNWPKTIAWAAGGVVLVGLLAFVISDLAGSSSGRPEAPEGVEVLSVPAASHTTGPVEYPHDPPAGGAHDGVGIECRAYDEPVRNEGAVHALEHGAVWITYSPDLAADQIDKLHREARRREVIVSPYPGLDSPIVLTVWQRQLRVDTADDARIEQFILALQNQTAPENAASC